MVRCHHSMYQYSHIIVLLYVANFLCLSSKSRLPLCTSSISIPLSLFAPLPCSLPSPVVNTIIAPPFHHLPHPTIIPLMIYLGLGVSWVGVLLLVFLLNLVYSQSHTLPHVSHTQQIPHRTSWSSLSSTTILSSDQLFRWLLACT